MLDVIFWIAIVVMILSAFSMLYTKITGNKPNQPKTTESKAEQPKTNEKPKTRTTMNIYYLVDTENAERVRKYYNQDLEEDDEYFQSAKELKESYDHEKVWKYEPVEIPFKLEGRDVYTEIEDEWFKIGRLKKTADIDGKLTCYFYVNEYKYVTEDSVEKEKGDDYFGIEVIKTIVL